MGSTSLSDGAARTQVSKKVFICLDEPIDWNLKVRRLRLSGWCVAKDGEPLIEIRGILRGQAFEGSFDRERPEVAAYVGLPHAPRWCGFTLDVRVPFGKSRLELQVARADGRWQKAFARNLRGPLTIVQAERNRWAEIEARAAESRYAFFIDRPMSWREPARMLYIAGWCIDRHGGAICGIRAIVGRRVFNGNHGIPREDLATAFPTVKDAPRGGFAIAVELPRRAQRIRLQVRDDDDIWHQLLSAQVNRNQRSERDQTSLLPEEAALAVPHPAPPRFEFWFDQPTDWRTVVRYLRISGWCFSKSSEVITGLRARIGRREFRANYGIVRRDVAASFAGNSAALRSGFALDVVYPIGRSTLVLEVRQKRGGWRKFFETEVRGPLFARIPRGSAKPIRAYAEWIHLYDQLTGDGAKRVREQIASFARPPEISVLLVAYNTKAWWLRCAIDSVRDQLYPHWGLCVVDDASTEPHVWRLLQQYARRDPRIKVLRRSANGGISTASNDALGLATGEYIALLGHEDQLAPTALYLNALALEERPDLHLLYSDEDKLDKHGRRFDPNFKPDWNPDLLASQNYASNLCVYRADLVHLAGGFRVGFEDAYGYDLTLRCVELIKPAQIHHLPHVLYHRHTAAQGSPTFGAASSDRPDAAVRAIQEHLDRRRIAARVVSNGVKFLRVIYSAPSDSPFVSIIIPTRDQATLLRHCIESIFAKTDYRNFAITLVDNESAEPETLEYFESLAKNERVSVVRSEGQFNYSRLNNLGVARARGVFVALLNNDLEVINRDWLTEMVGHASRQEIGAVGALLRYPDGTIQHGGVLLGVGVVATHAHNGLRDEAGYFGRALMTQNFSAVTGACMVMRRELYQQIGGLNEANLPVAFNDVDLCLRLREVGLRIVWTPHAQLIHHESASRGPEDTGAKQQRFLSEVAFMREKWGHILEKDPFYNPNLSLESNLQFKLAFPPRVSKPWDQEGPTREETARP